jgi:hypothetical protein
MTMLAAMAAFLQRETSESWLEAMAEASGDGISH